jgi:hypothetical protein
MDRFHQVAQSTVCSADAVTLDWDSCAFAVIVMQVT